jgi:predicted unusual protein kinase regulating ubiquinone biosynthesis (AarF/ABC1/UbiB family)
MEGQSVAGDNERNRLSSRFSRYAKVGSQMGGVAVGMLGRRIAGGGDYNASDAAALAQALGGLKGPLMKVAQLLATIPDAVPSDYALELSKLQSEAPPMGWSFVKRRMSRELGPDWQSRFASFSKQPAAAASLGQVHAASVDDNIKLACKLQYPDMASAVEADLNQLDLILSIHRRMETAIDTRDIALEIADRLREELDYELEAKHIALYRHVFADDHPLVRVPQVYKEFSTPRLLTMQWLDGDKILKYKDASQEDRNLLSTAMFKAWWHPFAHIGVIHGDPHLGNYTVRQNSEGKPTGINLLDYGCIRKFSPDFVKGVIELYYGLREDKRDRVVSAYELWGFRNLKNEVIDALNIWARFIYGPLMEDRVQPIAMDIKPTEYGRKQAFAVRDALRQHGPVKVPREFVFMDRAAIGLGAVFLHLNAELNFYRLFHEEIADFDVDKLADRQNEAFKVSGLTS